MTYW